MYFRFPKVRDGVHVTKVSKVNVSFLRLFPSCPDIYSCLDYKHGVSVFETKYIYLTPTERDVDWSHQDDLCVMALGAPACLANQDWANSSVRNSVLRSVECAFSRPNAHWKSALLVSKSMIR